MGYIKSFFILTQSNVKHDRESDLFCMKRLVWFFSAVGLTMTSTANAASDRIFISSGDRQLSVTVERQAASNEEIDAAINHLISNSTNTSNPLSYAAPQVQLTAQAQSLDNQSAPAIAARAAARAAHGKSIGRCAMYVRKALQSAGYKFTPQVSAYMYANGTLASAGFVKLNNNGYVPQVGDIAVFNRTGKNPHGHIQIYDGNQWVSDFRQPKFSPYSQHNGYTVWRDARYLDASSTQGTYLAMNEQ